MNVYQLARVGFSSFETAERDDGTSYTRRKDDAPAWTEDLVFKAHGDMLPDDWRYACIRSALGWIADNEPADLEDDSTEFADAEVDVYTAARFAWLSSHLSRQGYVDEAVNEFGCPEDFSVADVIGLGQYLEAQEVYGCVVEFLRELADEEEDENNPV